jgi:hypothetical protein
MFQLKYVEGAVPGKSLKRRTILSEDEQNQRKKKYEENHPDRKFNKNWKEGLQYDETRRTFGPGGKIVVRRIDNNFTSRDQRHLGKTKYDHRNKKLYIYILYI